MVGRRMDEDRSRFSGWADLALQTSLTLALSVLLLGWAGYALDGLLGTKPWLTVIGALWGAGGGTFWVVLRVKRFGDLQEEKDDLHGDNGENT